MNKEFMERYRTAFLMLLTIVITLIVLYISFKKDSIEYLDRALFFFAGMTIFYVSRSLIKSIKLKNERIGLEIEAAKDCCKKEEENVK